MKKDTRITIIGTGNIGRAIASGLAGRHFDPNEMILTRRRIDRLADLAAAGFRVQPDNVDAVARSRIVLVAVEPGQLDGVLDEIAPRLDPAAHVLISVVSGASIDQILGRLGKTLPVVRAMPNTAVALGKSMTCLSTNDESVLQEAVEIFDTVGMTMPIAEELMVPATALCACGVAFFLRAVRAASQGGIEISFHPDEALTMAAQTALGAASLVLEQARHPEGEIDRVTTPRGCTIAGLNEMEHQGFSSALIRGITISSSKAASLYERG